MYVSQSPLRSLAAFIFAACSFAVAVAFAVWGFADTWVRRGLNAFARPPSERHASERYLTRKVTAMNAIAKAFHVRPNMTPGWRMCSSI